MADEFGNNLRVGLTAELVAESLQLLAQFVGIVQRSVVNEGNPPRRVGVGVGILISLATVGGPTSVGDANVVTGRRVRVVLEEVDAIRLVAVAGVLGHNHVLAVYAGVRRHTGTVIPTILEHSQSLEQKVATGNWIK